MSSLAVLTALSALVAAAPPPQKDLRDWLPMVAEAEGLAIVQWGPVDLDRDGRADEAMAILCDTRPSGPRSPWRVYEANGQRWVLERDRTRCNSTPGSLPPFSPIDPDAIPILLTEGRSNEVPGPGEHDIEVFFELADNRLEITRYRWADEDGWSPGSLTQDWVHRVLRRTWTEYRYDTRVLPNKRVHHTTERLDFANDAAMIVVGSGADEHSTLNRILSGETAYHGPDDASLSVVAFEPSPGRVDIVIRITDDVPTSGDHLELWWCLHEDRCSREPEAIRQVTISWSDTQEPVATWQVSTTPDEPPPTVTRAADGTLTVGFAVDDLVHPERHFMDGFTRRYREFRPEGHPRQWWSTPFTVVFVDDDASIEGLTRIATSDLLADEPHSFGLLVRYPSFAGLERYPDHHPFPTHTGKILEELGLTGLRKLGPDELRLRRPW